MFALYKKEITSFFSSLTGYVAILVFLLASGIFMWIIPGNNNVLDNGYASLETFFTLGPWVFMFLIPAITMRLFSDEKKTGTIELLMTKPITDFSIVLAKYLGAFTIAIISLLPTLIFFISVYLLGSPAGNIDLGGTWGSYIGLFFLAMLYVAAGIFCSSLTDNQIVSFILSMIILFALYYGMDAFSQLFAQQKGEYFLQGLSISRHYQSMSRGVIDTRDVVYFLSLTSIFLLLTKFKLQSRKW